MSVWSTSQSRNLWRSDDPWSFGLAHPPIHPPIHPSIYLNLTLADTSI